MERVIVTVKRQDEARVRDLEVPAEIEARQLAELIARALNWDSDAAGEPIEYEIAAEPLGRVLAAGESLADAGVWDGAWLVFHQVGAEPAEPSAEQEPVTPPMRPPVDLDGPVIGWHSLGIDLPGESDAKQEDDADGSSTGYVWKQLD